MSLDDSDLTSTFLSGLMICKRATVLDAYRSTITEELSREHPEDSELTPKLFITFFNSDNQVIRCLAQRTLMQLIQKSLTENDQSCYDFIVGVLDEGFIALATSQILKLVTQIRDNLPEIDLQELSNIVSLLQAVASTKQSSTVKSFFGYIIHSQFLHENHFIFAASFLKPIALSTTTLTKVWGQLSSLDSSTKLKSEIFLIITKLCDSYYGLFSYSVLVSKVTEWMPVSSEVIGAVFADPAFLKVVCANFHECYYFSRFIGGFTFSPSICAALATTEANGFDFILSSLSSTIFSEEHIDYFLVAISNCCSQPDGLGEKLSIQFADNNAFYLLQPVLLHSNPAVAVRAAYSIGVLAMYSQEMAQRSGVYELMLDTLRTITVGSVQLPGLITDLQVPGVLLLLATHAPLAVQLAGVTRLAAMLANTTYDLRGITFKTLQNNSSVISGLRQLATGNDAFVYANAIYCLRALDKPAPVYRNTPRGDDKVVMSRVSPQTWAIDQVGAWVSTQPFRLYRTQFQESMINGKMLLTLTDDELESCGISNRLHRKNILFAIEDLKEEATKNSGSQPGLGRSSSLRDDEDPSSPLTVVPEYDVFIIYRRVGGADFAQLLKIHLMAKGLSVFLDTDNLGTGEFVSELHMTITRAKNVIFALTAGCMDRFLDDSDPLAADFVRREYIHSLKLQKNILPVYKEDFKFPAECRVPEDVRPVLTLNAIKWVQDYRDACLNKIVSALRL